MYYGLYKNLRNAAWKCLADFNIESLPVNLLKITRAAGIRVIKNSDVNDLLPGEFGKSYCNGINWYIIYDDTQPTEVSRFTIAHELGHIFLGHALTYAQYSNIQEFGTIPKTEDQADKFAIRLLCPASVLMMLEIYDAESIAKYCRVPISVAQKRAKRMQILRERNMFFTDQLEVAMFDNFKSYVEHEKLLRKFFEG